MTLVFNGPHIAGAVAMSPNKQHAKKHRQSGPDDILLGVFYEFKRSNDSRKYNVKRGLCIALRYVFGFGGYSY